MSENTSTSKNFYWTHAHIFSLLECFITLKAYSILDSTTTANSALYSKVVEHLKEYNGIEVTEMQARNKFKTLKREFRVNKAKADKSGAGAVTWPFYDKFIELEGRRPSSNTNDLGGESSFDDGQSEASATSSQTPLSQQTQPSESVNECSSSASTYRSRKRKLTRNAVDREPMLELSKQFLDELKESRLQSNENIRGVLEVLKDIANRPPPTPFPYPNYPHFQQTQPFQPYHSSQSSQSTPPLPSPPHQQPPQSPYQQPPQSPYQQPPRSLYQQPPQSPYQQPPYQQPLQSPPYQQPLPSPPYQPLPFSPPSTTDCQPSPSTPGPSYTNI